MFPIVYIYTVWFQFLHRINAAFGISKAFVPYRPPVVREAIEITSAVTVVTGYTLSPQSHLYIMGNNVFGEIIITKNSGTFSNVDQVNIGSISNQYAPIRQFISFCGFSASGVWYVDNIGYAFVQVKDAGGGDNGKIMVRDTVDNVNTCVHISVNYVV